MTQFEKDFEKTININGSMQTVAIYNLIVSKFQVGLFCKGITPYRNWRLTDIKNYFGISGSKHKVLEQLTEMVEGLK